MSPALVYGASGHALVVGDILRQTGRTPFCFVDGVDASRDGEAFGGAMVRDERALDEALAQDVRDAVVAFGDNAARLGVADRLQHAGYTLLTLLHWQAVVASDATVGAGTVVCAGGIVAPAAVVGRNVIVNTGATVDHECVIEDGVHLSPGVHLGGRVTVARGAWVGIGAVIRDKVTIGAGSVIGAGAVVLRDVPAGAVAYGTPARVVRYRDADTSQAPAPVTPDRAYTA